jgi:hypothetical protein
MDNVWFVGVKIGKSVLKKIRKSENPRPHGQGNIVC